MAEVRSESLRARVDASVVARVAAETRAVLATGLRFETRAEQPLAEEGVLGQAHARAERAQVDLGSAMALLARREVQVCPCGLLVLPLYWAREAWLPEYTSSTGTSLVLWSRGLAARVYEFYRSISCIGVARPGCPSIRVLPVHLLY